MQGSQDRSGTFRSSTLSSDTKKSTAEKEKQEFGLYLVNTRAKSTVLYIRKLAAYDFILKVIEKTMEMHQRDASHPQKLLFTKQADVEANMLQRGIIPSHFDEENKVVS